MSTNKKTLKTMAIGLFFSGMVLGAYFSTTNTEIISSAQAEEAEVISPTKVSLKNIYTIDKC